MTSGRSIRLFLADGTPGGIITAEIMNWTGHVMVAPRSRLPDLIRRDEAKRTGVYFLLGDDPRGGYKPMLYIGETDAIGKRLKQHAQDDTKDFWDRVYVVSSSDHNLSKAHVKYLESRLIAIAKRAGRATLHNGTTPDYTQLHEAEVAYMESFLEHIRLVLPVLGLDVLKETGIRRVADAASGPSPEGGPSPRENGHRTSRQSALDLGDGLFRRLPPGAMGYGVPECASTPVETAPTCNDGEFELSDRKLGKLADACEIEGEFVVLEGSFARADNPDSSNSYRNLRQSLKEDGTLREERGRFVFTRDTAFRSPSAASAVILDRNDNGRTSWRVKGKRGTTYADWQEAQVAAVTPPEGEA